jgi:hypothetical protein
MKQHLSVLVAVAVAFALPATVSAADAPNALQGNRGDTRPQPTRVPSQPTSSCTMAVPPTHATVEAKIANAADFCELVSRALAGDVFRTPVLVTPGLLWHYADATLSCRLRYGNTRYRMTIRNSIAACRWLRQLSANWHLVAATTE